MELRILGPVELVLEGRPVHLARRQQRPILGILAFEANRFVSRERLIDLVWGGDPPEQAKAVLHTRVSEIRAILNKHLDGARFLASHGGGYLLNIAPERVDLHRFQSLLRDARRAESDENVRQLLRSAGELWRGPVLGGWLPADSYRSFCAGVEEAKLTADEDLWEVEIRLGHHRLVVDEMSQAAARNPARERLVGLAMTALHRSGRTADALRHFEKSRSWLAAELGAEPGVELRALHQAMLKRTAATGSTSVPHLLPSVPSDFTGREEETARTRALLTGESSSVRMAVVTGPAGVGKSALSIRVAHRVVDHFPDGQLYADLRGAAAPGPAEVLARFLRALGAARVPDHVEERAALYRSMLAGKRVLVVLDNAHDPDHVRTLVPGAGACAVLITSRARLGALIGAASVELGLLGDSAALDLLTALAGRARIEREPGAAVDLVRLCGGLPLAIRIVAAHLDARPHRSIGRLGALMADDGKRLNQLAYGSLDVRASILQSYAGLAPAAKRLLCGLGTAGAADVDVSSSAALLGTTTDDAEEILEELHDARLLDANGTSAADGHHRYRLHDLVRLVAAERAAIDRS